MVLAGLHTDKSDPIFREIDTKEAESNNQALPNSN
jgi:hypothetical protein